METKIRQISVLEFIKLKDAWTGSKEAQSIEFWAISDGGRFELQTLKFSPALNKIIDEIVVNAIDHWTHHPQKVRNIDIWCAPLEQCRQSIEWVLGNGAGAPVDPKTYIVQVRNDGPGIDIATVKNVHGKSMYTVQMICSEFHSGTNFDDEDRITGGTNGAGMKLTNACSDFFAIETCAARKLYRQTFADRLGRIDAPTVVARPAGMATGTCVTFCPSYAALGGFDPTVVTLVRTRAHQAAAFTNCTVRFNGEVIKYDDFGAFVRAFLVEANAAAMVRMQLNGAHVPKFDTSFDVCVALSDGKARQVSLINGVYAHEGGNHIIHLQNAIASACKPLLDAELKSMLGGGKNAEAATLSRNAKNIIINNLFIFVKGNVMNASWNGNIKSRLDNPIEQFAPYAINAAEAEQIWHLLRDTIMSALLTKACAKSKTRVTRGAVDVAKGIDAQLAGKKRTWDQCTLIICEGDSAAGTVKEGVIKLLGFKTFGIFNIQGVPVNARKEVRRVTLGGGKGTTLLPKKKLQENERIASLVKMLGLDYTKTYALGTELGNAEFETLRYGRVVAATDQDEDGKGNIFGLLLNFFMLFWPALVERGYVRRFNTPILRAVPRSTKRCIEEFYTVKQFKTWADRHAGGEAAVRAEYAVNYCKGLGSHDRDEMLQLFKGFEQKLFICTLDADAAQNMEIFFGTATAPRKRVLATPVELEECDGPRITVSEQLLTDTKSYQRDNIIRKLSHVMDGFVPSRRAIIYGARAIFAHKNEKMKMNAFVSKVSSDTHYHHGEESLVHTAVRLAQDFPGARNLPFLYPRGQFGTRACGGKDAASARYIYTHLNSRLCFEMFPPADDWILPYKFDDGHRCEPLYFAPVVPLALLESIEVPATGWKIKIWARDVDEVIKNVRAMLSGKLKKPRVMGIWRNRNGSDIRLHKGKLCSFGRYTFDAKTNCLVVNELPIGMTSQQLIGTSDKGVVPMRDEYAQKPLDETSNDNVKVTFYFKPDAYATIRAAYGDTEMDCFEHYLGLKNSLEENINVIGVDGKILECGTTQAGHQKMFGIWFAERARLYAMRIDREMLLTRLRIKLLENVTRFVAAHATYDLSHQSIERISEILTRERYVRFNHRLLDSPKYASMDELARIEGGDGDNSDDASYDYLIDLKYRDMTTKACEARAAAMQREKQYLAAMEDDCGVGTKGWKTWSRELDKLEETIHLGLKFGWDYGKPRPKFRE